MIIIKYNGPKVSCFEMVRLAADMNDRTRRAKENDTPLVLEQWWEVYIDNDIKIEGGE